MNSKKFDNTGSITTSPHPILFNVRFFADDGDELIIYDNAIGPGDGTDIANLDKTNPYVDFGENGYFCHKGLFAFLPRGGKFRVVWEDN